MSLLLALPVAFFIRRTDIYAKNVLEWLYLLPVFIPPYVFALIWENMFPGSFLFSGLCGSVLVLGFSLFPFATLLLISGLDSVDSSLEEAGRITHSNFNVLKKITLPLLKPYVLSAWTLCFVLSMANYGVPSIMGYNVYTVDIFITFSAFFDHARASLLCIPLVAITITIVLFQARIMKHRSYVSISSSYRETELYSLEKWRGFISFVVIGSLVFLFFVPVGKLLANAGGLDAYKTALKTSYMEIGTTLFLSVSAATLCVVFSFFMAYVIEKTSSKISTFADVISLLPLAMPPTIIGLGLILLWNTPLTGFIYGSSLILLIAYISTASPFAIRILCSNLKQVSPHIEEAVSLMRVNYFSGLRKIILPLIAPGLKAAWAISFILCMRELGATLLVMPPGKETIPVKIYTLMHYGAHRLVASLSIILILLTIIPIVLVRYVFFKTGNKKI
ncbi:ABC transporter permease [Chlamydiota bacterium]